MLSRGGGRAGGGNIAAVDNKFNRKRGVEVGGRAVMDQAVNVDQERALCRRRTKAKRVLARSGNNEPIKLSAEDESNLIQMLNDTSSELYRLFSNHNPNKTPQQCYLDLKYSPPGDLESKSLYEKVLQYAQLHRKLGKRIKREKTVARVDPMPSSSSSKREDAAERNAVPVSQILQSDGANDRAKKKEERRVCPLIRKAEKENKVETVSANVKLQEDTKELRRASEVDEDAILKSYKQALKSKSIDMGLRMALLDEDCHNIKSNGTGDSMAPGQLPTVMRPRTRSPAPNGNCFFTRPMRANRVQHSLSSVSSSFELHKVNATCSVSSTSVSISTCEFEDNNTVQEIMNKICSLETKKRECRNTPASPRDLSALRKKQRGVLIEFTKEREKQRRRLSQAQENQNDSYDAFAKMSPKKNKCQTDEMRAFSGRNSGWPPSTTGLVAGSSRSHKLDLDLESCGLSASLFGNSAALKSFEKKSGMSIEDLLKRRESDLAFRKQRAQELLKWHQKITAEEESVKQLEDKLINRAPQPSLANSPPNTKQSVTGCSCNFNPCSCCNCCQDACETPKVERKDRLEPENVSLRCKEKNCCCENCSRTYCISGKTLNKIWRDISGLPCDKYNNCFEYNLTDSDFEELYATAKRERKVMRLGLDEGTRCPNFDREERERSGRMEENERMAEVYGRCRRGECGKDEEWSMLFHQPKNVELDSAAPEEGGEDAQKEKIDEAITMKNQEIELSGMEVVKDHEQNVIESPVVEKEQDPQEGDPKAILICEDNQLAMEEIEDIVNSRSPPRDDDGDHLMAIEIKHQNVLAVPELISEHQMRNGEEKRDLFETSRKESNSSISPRPSLDETYLCPSPTKVLVDKEEEMVEVLDLSTTRKRGDLSSGQVQADQTLFRNLPPVPLAYIVKEVPRVDKVLGMLRGDDKGVCPLDLTNPYLRILSQEIPYLIQEQEGGVEEGCQSLLENTVIDRLEQLRVYQLNLKRAHMGIGELTYEGPHYPHVQKIQDLVEYPQTEEDAYRASTQWSPPYQEKQTLVEEEELKGDQQQVMGDASLYSGGESMQRRYGAIQSADSCRDRSYEEEEGDYLDEEDEFLDYYSDMQYLKQSEQQILAIFTDHIMNSMLDDVVAVIQRNLSRGRRN